MVLGLTLDQIFAIAIVVGMLAFFIWDRWRYDVVALTALLTALAAGIVPAEKAFDGFSEPVIVIIVSVLVASKAIAKSGVLERLVRGLLGGVKSPSLQIGFLSASVGLLSAFIKNVGTLGIFMPIAVQVARRAKQSPSIYLMPLAFASLIGGTITQIGTSPNLLISTVRQDLTGEPFRLFDFAWVGLPLTLLTVLYLMVGWRLLPADRKGKPSAEEQFKIEDYTTELLIDAKSPLVGKSILDLEKSGGGDILVVGVSRDAGHHYIPSASWPIHAGDVVTVQAESSAIQRLIDDRAVKLMHAQDLKESDDDGDELGTVEAIVTAESPLVGRTPRDLALRRSYDVNLLAVSRAGGRRSARMHSHVFQVGDVVVLQGWANAMQGLVSSLGLLPLADRGLELGKSKKGLIPIGIMAIATLLISMQLLTVAVGFFAAAVLIILFKQISLKDAYELIDGPVIVLLAALIPIAESLQTTGVTGIIGETMARVGTMMPGEYAVAMMMAAAMALTPFVNNAAAVLILGPVAGVVAKTLGYSPDPFLMAVALGCACDFLTPIGHQNNLLVMGPGGYRFTDYIRLGLLLSVLILVAGTLLILYFWPLK